MAKRCALRTSNLLRGGLPRNSVDRFTDRPDMTSAVYRGRKASTQQQQQQYKCYKMLHILTQWGGKFGQLKLRKFCINLGTTGNYK